MAMVISPRSKIVTLLLLIGIITLVALIFTGVIGIWNKSEKPTKPGTKVVSSKLQQVTGYTATKHLFTGAGRALQLAVKEPSLPFKLIRTEKLENKSTGAQITD
ncbi:hypothetical protein WN48_09847 [Eufriesea mexicana]|uniref:Uncharacterized protein n=1 Tax=Eufriesea mexicana TaxID=516756 RepID=A0A310SRV1_9HYME|nr:hypothetical protein WN48_09847 [Eufriesea mexicana]